MGYCSKNKRSWIEEREYFSCNDNFYVSKCTLLLKFISTGNQVFHHESGNSTVKMSSIYFKGDKCIIVR